MSRRARIILVMSMAIGGIASCSAIIIYLKSVRLDAVRVRFTGPGAELKDASILGLVKKLTEPKIRLDVVHARGTDNAGSVLQSSFAGGVRFPVFSDIPLGDARELILVKVDSGKEHEVARARFAPPSMSSNGYTFSVESSRSWSVGLDWYLDTPIGRVVGFVAFLLFLLLCLYLAQFMRAH